MTKINFNPMGFLPGFQDPADEDFSVQSLFNPGNHQAGATQTNNHISTFEETPGNRTSPSNGRSPGFSDSGDVDFGMILDIETGLHTPADSPHTGGGEEEEEPAGPWSGHESNWEFSVNASIHLTLGSFDTDLNADSTNAFEYEDRTFATAGVFLNGLLSHKGDSYVPIWGKIPGIGLFGGPGTNIRIEHFGAEIEAVNNDADPEVRFKHGTLLSFGEVFDGKGGDWGFGILWSNKIDFPEQNSLWLKANERLTRMMAYTDRAKLLAYYEKHQEVEQLESLVMHDSSKAWGLEWNISELMKGDQKSGIKDMDAAVANSGNQFKIIAEIRDYGSLNTGLFSAAGVNQNSINIDADSQSLGFGWVRNFGQLGEKESFGNKVFGNSQLVVKAMWENVDYENIRGITLTHDSQNVFKPSVAYSKKFPIGALGKGLGSLGNVHLTFGVEGGKVSVDHVRDDVFRMEEHNIAFAELTWKIVDERALWKTG